MKGNHMKRRSMLLLLISLAIPGASALGQEPTGDVSTGSISGYVIDAISNKPVEYAIASLFDGNTGKRITGAVADKNGFFRFPGIKPGMYRVEIFFTGYIKATIGKVVIDAAKPAVALGTTYLEQSIYNVEGIEVVAEKPTVEFSIDKKVVNVTKSYTALSGTAVDVLQNVPSVNVDIEGNVSVRGSENFTVMIDGRPTSTAVEPSEALQQIPASTIQKIEVMTNPSAKYDPDGVAGIVNVILKKGKTPGFFGLANLSAGVDSRYGGDFIINRRQGKFQIYLGANYYNHDSPGNSRTESWTTANDTVSHINSDGTTNFGGSFSGLRTGIDVHLTAKDVWGLGFRYNDRQMNRLSALSYDEWTEPGGTHSIFINEDSSYDKGYGYSVTSDYRHAFLKNIQELSGQFSLHQRNGRDESTNELLDSDSAAISGQRNVEEGPSTNLRLNIDYFTPLLGANRLEAGLQSRIERSEEGIRRYDYDSTVGDYVFQPDYSHTSDYTHDIFSMYTTCSGKLHKFGYKAGIRGEYSDRVIDIVGENETFKIDYLDFFPSAHVSYQFPGGHQAMASYTRRIERLQPWFLEPFETWMNAYNVQRGNPSLRPQHINSFELGYQRYFGKSTVSLETYYRTTENKIERVTMVYPDSDNVLLHTVENVGTDHTFGTELMMNIDLFKWYNLNATGNLYDYRIEGTILGEPLSQESYNWSIKMNNTFKIGEMTRIQLNGTYHSPTVSSQGRRAGFYTTNLGIRRDFLRKQLSLTLQVRDILGTAGHESTSEGPDFYSYREFSRRSRVVMLNISFNFNDYKPDRRGEEPAEDFEEEEIY
jgi:outer membrane receptor protein involved in Fe transport